VRWETSGSPGEGGLDVDPPVVLSYRLRQIERQAEAKDVPGLASDFQRGLDSPRESARRKRRRTGVLEGTSIARSRSSGSALIA
jgi:hypothetical protein